MLSRGLRCLGSIGVLVASVLVALSLEAEPAGAEVQELRLARQFGVASLPAIVMLKHGLLEKQLGAAGLASTRVDWRQFSGGSTMNDALLSGQLHIAAAGVTPILTIWDKTKGTDLEIKGVAALGAVPVVLITNNPRVRSIKDFTEKDRIAVPAVRVSIQAVCLQMAAAQAFGPDQHARLDALTVSMPHPTAFAALMSRTEVSGHVTSSPFVEQELESPNNRVVLSSQDLLGPTTNVALYTTRKFHAENPKTYKAVLAALGEAIEIINRDKKAAVRAYIEVEKSKMSEDFLLKAFSEPNVFTTTPQGFMKFADFMHRIKTLKNKPADWKELWFPEIHGLPGS